MGTLAFKENDIIKSQTGTERVYRVTRIYPWGVIYAVPLQAKVAWPLRIDADSFRYFKVVAHAA